MEGEEGDLGPNPSGMPAQAPSRGYPPNIRPPGVRRGFEVEWDVLENGRVIKDRELLLPSSFIGNAIDLFMEGGEGDSISLSPASFAPPKPPYDPKNDPRNDPMFDIMPPMPRPRSIETEFNVTFDTTTPVSPTVNPTGANAPDADTQAP